MHMNSSERKVVVITGATGNLGSATAEAFQRLGARTVLVDRSFERLQRHYPSLVDSSDHFLAGDINVADSQSISDMFDQVIRRFGRVDVLVNTVGGYRGGKRVDQEDPDSWVAAVFRLLVYWEKTTKGGFTEFTWVVESKVPVQSVDALHLKLRQLKASQINIFP